MTSLRVQDSGQMVAEQCRSEDTDIRMRNVGVVSLVAIGFFWTCGGIYGNEELLVAGPPFIVCATSLGMALAFALPNALVTAELASAFPECGGQVVWVDMVCNRFVSGQNAFWIWTASIIDSAVYPSLIAKYISNMVPHPWVSLDQWIRSGTVTCITLVNLSGSDCTSITQGILFVCSLLPTLTFLGMGLPHLSPSSCWSSSRTTKWDLLVAWSLWNYSGFSSLGAMAGEVAQPQKTYPTVMLLLFPFVVALNVLPVLISFSLDPSPHDVQAGYFGTLAGQLAGHWLQVLFTAGATLSLVGMCHSQILRADRTLAAFLASRAAGPQSEQPESLLPRPPNPAGGSRCGVTRPFSWLCGTPAGGGVPRACVLFNALAVWLLTELPIQALVEAEMILFCLTQALFLYSFVAIRVRMALAPRPFRVPGGLPAALLLCAGPLVASAAMLWSSLGSPARALAFCGVLFVGLGLHAAAALCLRPRRARSLGPRPS